MAKSIQRPAGTQDILPESAALWNFFVNTAAEAAHNYGFEEIQVPTFEYTEVFTGTVGESSDIVQKEMYTVSSKGENTYTLRPELTAGIVRAIIENGLLNAALPLKVFSIGSVFRHEKNQKGRFREFHQFGVECFGTNDPSADAEVIALAADILDRLGIRAYRLHLNSIGCPVCRKDYLEALRAYYRSFQSQLDEDSLKRLEKNPMRILDSKVASTIALNENAPKMLDHLCEECASHFSAVQERLHLVRIPYIIDEKLVRGLDYYTNTVFEFISENIGAQGTICGGGRYNLLVEQRGGKPTPGLGFGLGIERVLLELSQTENAILPEQQSCDLYFVTLDEISRKKAFQLADALRREDIRAEYDLMNRGMKAQMKYADKIGANYVIVLGENELLQGIARLKNMESGEELEVPLDESLADFLYNAQVADALADLENSVHLWEPGGSSSASPLGGLPIVGE